MDHSSGLRQDEWQRLHTISSQLWGNQDRFVVAVAVASAEPGQLYAQALARMLGISDTRVGPHLARFEQAGLLVRLPKVGGERRVYFERRNEAFWRSIAAMHEAFDR
jgi:DNA-binding MarR family transcriptional regulator